MSSNVQQQQKTGYGRQYCFSISINAKVNSHYRVDHKGRAWRRHKLREETTVIKMVHFDTYSALSYTQRPSYMCRAVGHRVDDKWIVKTEVLLSSRVHRGHDLRTHVLFSRTIQIMSPRSASQPGASFLNSNLIILPQERYQQRWYSHCLVHLSTPRCWN